MMSARAVNFLKYSLLLTPFALLPIVSSCNSGGGGGGGGNAYQNALFACGLISAGEFGGGTASADPFINCYTQCIAGGTCAELEDLVCNFGPDGEALTQACYTQCIQAHGHGCDGITLPPFSVCDGFEDCSDGSDEVGCEPNFTCGDGSEIPPSWKCDGEADCQDASDEAGCPAAASFTCNDGTQIPQEWRCDLEQDCQDGSDEAGCAMLLCPDNGTSSSETFGTFTTSTSVGTEGGLDTSTGG